MSILGSPGLWYLKVVATPRHTIWTCTVALVGQHFGPLAALWNVLAFVATPPKREVTLPPSVVRFDMVPRGFGGVVLQPQLLHVKLHSGCPATICTAGSRG